MMNEYTKYIIDLIRDGDMFIAVSRHGMPHICYDTYAEYVPWDIVEVDVFVDNNVFSRNICGEVEDGM